MRTEANSERKWRALSEARYRHKLNILHCPLESPSLVKQPFGDSAGGPKESPQDSHRSDASTSEREPRFVFPMIRPGREITLRQSFASLRVDTEERCWAGLSKVRAGL